MIPSRTIATRLPRMMTSTLSRLPPTGHAFHLRRHHEGGHQQGRVAHGVGRETHETDGVGEIAENRLEGPHERFRDRGKQTAAGSVG